MDRKISSRYSNHYHHQNHQHQHQNYTSLSFIEEKSQANQTPENKRLFIGALPYNITRLELMEYFKRYGTVVDLYLPFDKRKGSLKGFAFVEFLYYEEYLHALNQPRHSLRGQDMVIRSAMDKEKANKKKLQLQKRKLYVKGFPVKSTEREIRQFFRYFGTVNRVLMAWAQGKRKFRGFCYIVMEDKYGYERVMNAKEKLFFKGNKLQVLESKTEEELEGNKHPNKYNVSPNRNNKIHSQQNNPGELEPVFEAERNTLWYIIQESEKIRRIGMKKLLRKKLTCQSLLNFEKSFTTSLSFEKDKFSDDHMRGYHSQRIEVDVIGERSNRELGVGLLDRIKPFKKWNSCDVGYGHNEFGETENYVFRVK